MKEIDAARFYESSVNFTKLHEVISQKTNFIFTTAKHSNLKSA
jgi:hypothetical protein